MNESHFSMNSSTSLTYRTKISNFQLTNFLEDVERPNTMKIHSKEWRRMFFRHQLTFCKTSSKHQRCLKCQSVEQERFLSRQFFFCWSSWWLAQFFENHEKKDQQSFPMSIQSTNLDCRQVNCWFAKHHHQHFLLKLRSSSSQQKYTINISCIHDACISSCSKLVKVVY